jgi:hypothetical protein
MWRLAPLYSRSKPLFCAECEAHNFEISSLMQGRSVHVNRVSPANTLIKQKIESLTFVVRWWLTAHGWLELANDAFYLIGAAVFQCMEYHWTTKVGLLFFICQRVSRANTVNMNAPPLFNVFVMFSQGSFRDIYFLKKIMLPFLTQTMIFSFSLPSLCCLYLQRPPFIYYRLILYQYLALFENNPPTLGTGPVLRHDWL